jgi:ParB family chromosome partitioning protein
MLQNLVVEPETNAEGEPTGFYLVSVGEGRRLAQLLRAKRKEIKKTEPNRCVIDTANDAAEISLDENVNRENLHPADEFEKFRELSEDRGWGAEEIAARFGKSAHVVKQRLRLGAVSPKLIQVYRDGGLTMDQLQAFAITDDHARQEQVFENLSYNKEPWIIRRDLTAINVAATDRRAAFIGAEAYTEAGGNIIRDLFTEDRGGFYEDAALLDRLVLDKLERIAAEVQVAEGWKWVSAHIDWPHAHGMRRTYLREMWDRYGNVAAMLAAYNVGPGRYDEYLATGRTLPAETRAYVAALAPVLGGAAASEPPSSPPPPPPDWREAPLFVMRSGDARPAATLPSEAQSGDIRAVVPVRDPVDTEPQGGSIFVARASEGGTP